jgi:hypothetical protein
MDEAEVYKLIGEPDYVTVKSFGGFKGGRVDLAACAKSPRPRN